MKNYYEILQVDKNASDQIIKVAYKSLVKKYHPDLKEGQEKTLAEEKIKQINEAYDILSDPSQRAEYDQTLVDENISIEDYNFILNENKKLKNELNYYKNNYTNLYNENENENNNYYNYNQTQNIDYSNYPNTNYENKKTIFNNLSEGLKNVIALFITLLILFFIFKIPFINQFFIQIFGENFIILLIIIFAFFVFFRNRK